MRKEQRVQWSMWGKNAKKQNVALEIYVVHTLVHAKTQRNTRRRVCKKSEREKQRNRLNWSWRNTTTRYTRNSLNAWLSSWMDLKMRALRRKKIWGSIGQFGRTARLRTRTASWALPVRARRRKKIWGSRRMTRLIVATITEASITEASTTWRRTARRTASPTPPSLPRWTWKDPKMRARRRKKIWMSRRMTRLSVEASTPWRTWTASCSLTGRSTQGRSTRRGWAPWRRTARRPPPPAPASQPRWTWASRTRRGWPGEEGSP